MKHVISLDRRKRFDKIRFYGVIGGKDIDKFRPVKAVFFGRFGAFIYKLEPAIVADGDAVNVLAAAFRAKHFLTPDESSSTHLHPLYRIVAHCALFSVIS